MPSPFPGMDPYLEDSSLWPGFHHTFITYLREHIRPHLRPNYYAEIQERIYLAYSDHQIYPDISVLRQQTLSQGETAAVATAEWDEPVVAELRAEEIHEAFIEIRNPADHRVVTVIEVLSPSNKTSGGPGREKYLQKQQELLESQTHLIEIDLVRDGQHTVALPEHLLFTPDSQRRLEFEQQPWYYLINICRAGRAKVEFYPCSIRRRLPRIVIPLQTPDEDFGLNLQEVFARCYDQGDYGIRFDYTQSPFPPLPIEDAPWAEKLLRERGKRPPP